ncbi:signal transduction histidine kinase [Amycolatopsis echigonensis]|uniref:Oxygen sensor histidine kinase NreB n=1 Tax=Amycolatopsis echigonensis TaxID=2576905 RepID=A0A2N3WIU7_9PSEU|nr:sensor histidine kinase [Amycolatopsis niigatensis]PKV93795.1 signal transduction histidine kinase [Amycolatopsis niigatensis]
MDKRSEVNQADAWERSYWSWEVLFAVAYVATALLVFANDGSTTAKIVAEAAMGAIAVGYLAAGRRVVHGDDNETARRIAAGALIALTATAILATTVASFVLFLACPLLFMLLDLRPAIVATTLLILLEPVSAVLSGGWNRELLSILLPMTAILIVFSVLAGKVTSDVLQQSHARAELIRELESSQAEVARLSREAGTAAERERLAREIHDTLAQGFTSIITLTQAIESELDTDLSTVRRHLALAGRTARENLAEARAMVAALAPSDLATGSLPEAVQRQADRLAEETGIPVECEVDDALPSLSTAVEVVLLRAAQEALSNVRKHSGATLVRVRLSAVDGAIRLCVADNGCGFTPDADGTGFGLRGMRSRAEQVGGALKVRTGANGGAELELEVPA